MLCSTREAARLLDVKPSRLAKAVWDGRITPPPKGPGGVFAWNDLVIQEASMVLHGQPLVNTKKGERDENQV